MRSLTTFIALLAACTFPAYAAADEPDTLEARFSTGFITGSFRNLTVRRVDIGAGIMYRPRGLPLMIGTGVHVGPTSVSLRGPISPDAVMDTSLMQWANLSLEARAQLTIHRGRTVRFDLYGGFEMSALDDSFTVTRGELAVGSGRSYDITPFLDNHLALRYGWSRMDTGLIASLALGRFTPRLAVGFQRLMIRMTAELDTDGKTILRALTGGDGSVERLYEEDVTSIRIAPGLDTELSRTMGLSMDATFMPAAGAFFIGGTASLRMLF